VSGNSGEGKVSQFALNRGKQTKNNNWNLDNLENLEFD
jgi:hypothetical protein